MTLFRARQCDPVFHEVTTRRRVHLFARDPAQRWVEALAQEQDSFRDVYRVMHRLAFGGGRGVITAS